ncbi:MULTISPECIES: GFA family protein [Phenylobacterium]|uniref:CENP-V/GFA domain-containing protein n=1 Tax=Phenylobacterium koreense TaxID=266125 RepID=A0ABV2EHW2_9CAUL
MLNHTGGCLCGEVRYEAEGEPINVRVCHCRLCQRAIGAAFNARALFSIDKVRLSGAVASAHSSPGVKRGFCAKCGTTLYSMREDKGVMGLTFGSLDEPDRLAPTEHIWTSSKQAWLELDDGLPQHPEGHPG